MIRQLSFSTLWDGYATNAEAKKERDLSYQQARRLGKKARRWVLKNQVKKYESFGMPDGRSCDVYKLDIHD